VSIKEAERHYHYGECTHLSVVSLHLKTTLKHAEIPLFDKSDAPDVQVELHQQNHLIATQTTM